MCGEPRRTKGRGLAAIRVCLAKDLPIRLTGPPVVAERRQRLSCSALRGVGTASQYGALLALPLLHALGKRRPHTRSVANGLRRVVEAEHLPEHGRARDVGRRRNAAAVGDPSQFARRFVRGKSASTSTPRITRSSRPDIPREMSEAGKVLGLTPQALGLRMRSGYMTAERLPVRRRRAVVCKCG